MNRRAKEAPGAPDTPGARDRAAGTLPPVILHVIPRLQGGGAEAMAVALAAAAAQAGWRVLVASEGGTLVARLRTAGCEWRRFPAASKNPLRMLANVYALARLIRREKVALVHVHSRAPAWSALFAARRTKTPFVTSYHGAHSYRGALKTFYNSVMARGDAVIANSDYTAGMIRTHHPFAAGRMTLIHCGVDLAVFDPARVAGPRVAALRKAWLREGMEKIVLLPGRLRARKGHAVAIEAMKRLADGGLRNAVLVFLGGDRGEGDYAARLEALIAQAGLAGRVRLVGVAADMAAAYAAADLVLVPSREPESFGLVAAEAQAMGVPVIVSDAGALPEIVLAPPGVAAARCTGWCVPTGDSSALAAAMREALALTPRQRAALARRARRHAEQHFSLAQMTADTIALYRRLAPGPARASEQAADKY